MKLTFLGPIRRPDSALIDVLSARRDECTVEELLTVLGYPPDQHRLVRVFEEGRQVGQRHTLDPDAEIALMLTVGGG